MKGSFNYSYFNFGKKSPHSVFSSCTLKTVSFDIADISVFIQGKETLHFWELVQISVSEKYLQ